jgi:hypothetical protein
MTRKTQEPDTTTTPKIQYQVDATTEERLSTAENNDTKLYHPAHNIETGGALPTIFLAQVKYWFHKGWAGHKPCTPFYKFIQPAPTHGLYRPGESWVEELGIGKTALGDYLNKFGVKLKPGEYDNWQQAIAEANRQELEEGAAPVYFVFWTRRSDNLTYWAFNGDAYLRMRLRAYKIDGELLPDAEVGLPDAEVGLPDAEVGLPDSGNPNNRDYSEITQRLHREVEGVGAVDINANGKKPTSPTGYNLSSLSRKEMLVEIAKLPNTRLYSAVTSGWGRHTSDRTMSIKDRQRVLEAVIRIHREGYSGEGGLTTVWDSDGRMYSSEYLSFGEWWVKYSRIGRIKGEYPNTPKDVADYWEDYQAFCWYEGPRLWKNNSAGKLTLDPITLPTVEGDIEELARKGDAYIRQELKWRRLGYDFYAGKITFDESNEKPPFDAEREAQEIVEDALKG